MDKKFIFIAFIGLFFLSGCVVTQSRYDLLADQLDQVNSEKAQVEADKAVLEAEKSGLSTQIDDLNSQISVLEASVDDAEIISEIKSDYIEFLQYVVTLASIEGSLDHQYQLWKNGDEIYTDVYKQNVVLYNSQMKMVFLKVDRIIEKLEENKDINIEGLPEEFDTPDELADFKAGVQIKYNMLEDETRLM